MGLRSSRPTTPQCQEPKPVQRGGSASLVSSPTSSPRTSPRTTWPSPMGLRPQRPGVPRISAPLPSRGTAEGQAGSSSPSRKLEQVKLTILEDPNVLKDAQWCAAFVRYLGEGYQADLLEGHSDDKPSAVKSARKLQATARVFFDFWADLTDLECCHAPSNFHSLRLEAIVDRYLSRGADTPVPLSESVRSSLLGDDGAGKASQDSLSEARDEAFRYLSSEVLPHFVRSQSPLGLVACLYSTKRVVWTLGETARKVNAYPDLMNILIRVASSQAFHAYMKAKDETLAHMVTAAIEVVGYKSMADFWALQRWRQKNMKSKGSSTDKLQKASSTGGGLVESADLLQTRLEITTAHDIFDSHLRLGQTIRRILPSFVVPELLGAASNPASLKSGGGALPVTLFDEVLVYLLNHLSEHLPEYQKSPQATSLQHALDVTVEVSIEDLEEQREELEILLGTSFLKGPFESYLTNHKDPQAIWTFRFHQAVDELQASKSEAPLAVFSKVVKIFLTYARRGAPCELAILGGAPRIQLIERLIQPGAQTDVTVYDAPQALAFDTLATQWLPSFEPGDWQAEVDDMLAHGQGVEYPHLPLSSILESSTALAVLRSFAVSEHFSHPLQFWLEAESYRTLPRADLLLARGRAIAEKYTAPGATRSVPLSEPIRERILTCCDSELVGPGLFIEAQVQVYEWMETELLPKFVQSPGYQTLAAQVRSLGRSVGIWSLSSRMGLPEAALTGPLAETGGREQLALQASHADFGASMTVSESTFEDVLLALQQGEDVDYVKLMTRLLDVAIARQYFTEYCKERDAYKYLAFWLDAEDFCKHLPGNRNFRKSQARKLVTKYIADGAVMKVPIPYLRALEIGQCLESPARTVFKEAQEEVLSYMANDLLPGFLESPQFKTMMQANALASRTPWSRMSRRLVGMFMKSVGSDPLNQSIGLGETLKKAASTDSLGSIFSHSSSSMGDSLGVSTGELGESGNWPQRLSSSFRKVLNPLALDSSFRRERLHRKALSDSRLDMMGRSTNPEHASSLRSRSSDALSATVGRDPWGYAPEDAAMEFQEGEGDGEEAPDRTPRRITPSVQAPSSPRWQSPSRVSPMTPSKGWEESSNGRMHHDAATQVIQEGADSSGISACGVETMAKTY